MSALGTVVAMVTTHITVLSLSYIQFRILVEFLIGQFILGVIIFPFDWDLCGEYRQPIALVGGA